MSKISRDRLLGKTRVDLYGLEKANLMSAKYAGDKNPAKRKEVREKISKALKGKKHSLEHRRKLSESRKAKYKKKMWVHDGIKETLVTVTDGVPDGYFKGRLKHQ